MTDTSKNNSKDNLKEHSQDNKFADKQSLTALKMHGEKIIYAVLVVLAVFFSWQYYQKNYAKIDTVAADAYTSIASRDEQILQAAQNPELDDAAKQKLAKEEQSLLADIDGLVAAHGDTAYAWQALMIKARHQSDSGDVKAAVATLEQAMAMPIDDEGLLAVAKIRHARAMLASGDAEGALAAAEQALPAAFEASRQELLGDVYVAKNDLDNAKKAYMSAWEALRERQENRAVLALKLQSLGVSVEPIIPPQVTAKVDTAAIDNQASQGTDGDKSKADTQTPQSGN
ncbi:YfgM family protein [Moraxella marmotae]|uniref:YfgM family protein n=1 Tax=Moraxella marmotae TaxID=3344520 RepID=UPI0035F2893D